MKRWVWLGLVGLLAACKEEEQPPDPGPEPVGGTDCTSSSGQALELSLRLVSRVLGPKLANGAAQALGGPWLTAETTRLKGT